MGRCIRESTLYIRLATNLSIGGMTQAQDGHTDLTVYLHVRHLLVYGDITFY